MAFPGVDGVGGGGAFRCVVGSGGGGRGEAGGFAVFLGGEGCVVGVLERCGGLLFVASFFFGGGVPDAGVVGFVVGLEGEARLGEGGFVFGGGFAYCGHGLWWV